MTNWKEIHPDFTPELQKDWESEGFEYETCKSWIEFGCRPHEVGLVDYLWECQRYKFDKDIEKARIEYPQWKNLGFSLSEIMKWKNRGFTPKQTKKFLDIGLTSQDVIYCVWLRDFKQLDDERILTNEQQFRVKYKSNKIPWIWLEQNYPNKRVLEIYINQQLEGVLDCSEYENLRKISISLQVNRDNFEIIKGSYKNDDGELQQTQVIQLINVQKWLEKYYPKSGTCQRKKEGYDIDNFGKTREQIENLSMNNKDLEGELDLSDFKNLEGIWCSNNKLTKLNLTNCTKLKKIDCSDNHLTQIIYPISSEQLTNLNISNNNFFEQDLSMFTKFKNLEWLYICNGESILIMDESKSVKDKINQGIYNRFYGSLEPLKNLNKLKRLDISNTDIDRGVEYLPENLEKIYYETKARPDCKLGEIKEQLDLFPKYKNWIKLSFSPKKIKEWEKVGLKVSEHNLANYLVQQGCQPTTSQIEEIVAQETWRDIHPDFTYLFRKIWESQGFNKDQTKNWIEIGFKPNKCLEAKEWRDNSFTIEQVQEWIQVKAKLSDYKFIVWLRDTKKETPRWVSNYREDYKNLSERFEKYGVCSECNNPNTGEEWCKGCNAKHFKSEFSNWTSGNQTIDKFIRQHQLNATETNKVLEWIPYEQFEDVEYLAEGGFGKVHKAEWKEGAIINWDSKDSQWVRRGDNCDKKSRTIVLKSLNKSQNITQEFLEEVKNHKVIDDWFQNIVQCHGISQDPNTGNYLMVMEYIEGGNLRELLKKDYHNLDFQGKLKRLINIAQGLKDIHQKNLIHRDFHSGNILSDNKRCFIADLGLSKLSEEVNDGKIMGVLPYIAPEVLRGNEYSKDSDIYSFGVIAAEILTGLPPYYNTPHDEQLTIRICRGLRPNLDNIKVPKLLKDLISKCWDADPFERPTANYLVWLSQKWQEEVTDKKYGEFYQQYLETEKLSNAEKERKICELLSELHQRYKGEKIEVKFEKRQKIKDELFPDFYKKHKSCKQHNFGEDSVKAREEFEKLFSRIGGLNYEIHPSAIYTSRLLDFKNLPEPQNSKKVNEEFYSKKQERVNLIGDDCEGEEIDFTELENEVNEIKGEQLQTNIEQPPK